MKENAIPGLDILKFIMALLVVAIHAQAVNDMPRVYRITLPIINSAVPVFFIVSSYLLFKKIRQSHAHQAKGILLHFTYRLIALYLFWAVIQFPLILNTRHYISMSLFEFLANFFLDIVLRSTFHGAWFLSALVLGVWIVFAMTKIFTDRNIWVIPLLFTLYSYHADLLPMEYQSLWICYKELIVNPQNSFPVALFWVSAGYIIANPVFKELIKKNDIIKVILLFILSWLITIWGVDLRFFMAISIFLVFLNWNISYRPIYKQMRQSSIVIFILHFIFIGLFRYFFPNILFLQQGIVLYIILLILCLISYFIIWKLEKYKYFSWLKYSH